MVVASRSAPFSRRRRRRRRGGVGTTRTFGVVVHDIVHVALFGFVCVCFVSSCGLFVPVVVLDEEKTLDDDDTIERWEGHQESVCAGGEGHVELGR